MPAKLSCSQLWKLYGNIPPNLLKGAGFPPSKKDLEKAGVIGAVQAVELEINEGEIFVIMGLSGSGKSTLVRLLAGLIEPTMGEIYMDGQDILKMSSRELIEVRRHKMGMVFQHFALLPHLSVLQNVMFPLEVQGQKKPTAEARAREVIELVGLKGREDYYPRELSGGQQQRVGIARSLAVEPDLWFLDEPFSALDPLIRREMQDEFMRLQAMLKKTIVFITHDFDEAIRLADRIAIMKGGRVIQVATPEVLVQSPADDYVREFTKHIPRDKVVSVGAVMEAGREGVGEGLPASAKIADVAAQVVSSTQPLTVVDKNGTPIGSIDREQVISVLAGV